MKLSHVHVKNQQVVGEKIKKLIEGNQEKLQVFICLLN